MPGKYELKKSRGQFMFNLKASNGKVILTSERYKSKASAMNGIASVRKNGSAKGNFDLRKAKNNAPYFVLQAKNGEVIGRSEMYSGTTARTRGIESVRKNAKGAKLDDQT